MLKYSFVLPLYIHFMLHSMSPHMQEKIKVQNIFLFDEMLNLLIIKPREVYVQKMESISQISSCVL